MIWEVIRSRNLGAERVKSARLQTLMNEFDRLKMDDSNTIDTLSGKISELASKEKRDYSQIVCYNCKKKGHFASVCTKKKDDEELNKAETEVAEAALYMHEVVFLSEEKLCLRSLKLTRKKMVCCIWTMAPLTT